MEKIKLKLNPSKSAIMRISFDLRKKKFSNEIWEKLQTGIAITN